MYGITSVHRRNRVELHHELVVAPNLVHASFRGSWCTRTTPLVPESSQPEGVKKKAVLCECTSYHEQGVQEV